MRMMFGLALALASAATPAWATGKAMTVSEAATSLAPNAYVWGGADQVMAQGPVQIIVSISDQRAYVYQGETLIAASTVSTGKDGKETPLGTFPILQKQVMHKSNLYDSAPMPYMQRLTWDGVAIHAGRNPGYAASHGCIRVPTAFAKKLYEVTQLGTSVTVTDESISDPAYYVPPAPQIWSDPVTQDETRAANTRVMASTGG